MIVCLPCTSDFNRLPKKIRARIRRLSPRATACWLWTGPRHYSGKACACVRIDVCKCYGRQWHDGRNWLAHRLTYTLLVGEIPHGLVLDHLKAKCSSRRCVRPDHLEPVTIEVNTMRGGGRFGGKKLQPLPVATPLPWVQDEEVPF